MNAEQCEYCDRLFSLEEYDSEDGQPYTVNGRAVCSAECQRDAEDDVRVGKLEAQSQREMYGDDFDSWD